MKILKAILLWLLAMVVMIFTISAMTKMKLEKLLMIYIQTEMI